MKMMITISLFFLFILSQLALAIPWTTPKETTICECSGVTSAGGWNNATAGQVNLHQASDNVSAGVLFIDNVNNRVGINTQDPDQALHIQGVLHVANWIDVDGSVVMGDGQYLGTSSDTPHIIFDSTNDYFEFLNGSVGIEDSSPTHSLTIKGNKPSIQVGNAFSYVPIAGDFVVGQSNADSRFLFGHSNNYFGGMTWNYDATPISSYLTISSDGSGTSTIPNQIVLARDGDVGIHDITPDAHLDIEIQSSGDIGQIIQAAPGQTAHLLDFRDSTGTSLIRVEDDSTVRDDDRLKLYGAQTKVGSTSVGLNMIAISSSNTGMQGSNVNNYLRPTADIPGGASYGQLSTVYIGQSGLPYDIGQVRGMFFNLNGAAGWKGTVTNAYTLFVAMNPVDGNYTNAYGLKVQGITQGTNKNIAIETSGGIHNLQDDVIVTGDVNVSDGVYVDENIEAVGNVSVGGSLTTAKYSPSSIYNVTGTTDGDSTLTNILTSNDGLWYNVSEVTGTPGFEIHINFTDVNSFNNVLIREYYEGGATHEITVDLWNVNTASWEQLILPHGDQTNMHNWRIPIFDSTAYTNDRKVRLRVMHNSAGIASHDMYLDYLGLER